jgi:hypothetical protein
VLYRSAALSLFPLTMHRIQKKMFFPGTACDNTTFVNSSINE